MPLHQSSIYRTAVILYAYTLYEIPTLTHHSSQTTDPLTTYLHTSEDTKARLLQGQKLSMIDKEKRAAEAIATFNRNFRSKSKTSQKEY